MNLDVSNTVAASTFLVWDYCISFDDEIEFIWRQKWSWVTVVFSIIRYGPIISSNLLIADIISPLITPFNDNCVAWSVAYATWTTVLIICFEVLLIARVLPLYGQHRLLRYALIALTACVNIARVILLAITKYESVEEIGSHVSLSRCQASALLSIDLSALFIVEFLPEATFFSLAVFKLIHTKRTVNFAVSQLLIVIVRDGAWAFALIFAFLIWTILQLEFSEHRDISFIWVAPLIGFTCARLTFNLRSQARPPRGGTTVNLSEIKFATINFSDAFHEIS